MTLEELEPIVEEMWELCSKAGRRGNALDKARSAVAFIRELKEQNIIDLTPKLEEDLEGVLQECQKPIDKGAVRLSCFRY